MILTSLTLQHFRSYAKRVFSFSPGVTLVIGPNGSGKTNILEALVLLSTGKSFRADVESEMVAWDHELARVGSLLGDTKVELLITHGMVQGKKVPTKKYFVNGISRRSIDFIGNVRTVLFWPEHLELVTDSPSVRRRYIDSVLVQVDREYRRNLLSYEKGLRQRNKLLEAIGEGRAQRHQLIFWDQLLIKAGGYITDKRAQYVEYVNEFIIPIQHYHVIYDKSIISASRLAQYEVEEVGAKATLVGPHRDDLTFEIKNIHGDLVDLSKYGSRGEQRLGVLWLKLAELSFIEKEVGERPTLLLDDIFSELDEEHREVVMNLVTKQQTIVTSADRKSLPHSLLQASSKIELVALTS